MTVSDYTVGVVTASVLSFWLLFPFGELNFGIGPSWAFDFLHYVAWYFRLLMAGVVVALALPAVQRCVFRILERMRRPPFWILILLSSVLFWSLREQTFHGDGLRKVGLLSVAPLHSMELTPAIPSFFGNWRKPSIPDNRA